MAMTAPSSTTLVLRFADLGVATYGSLRIVGQPERTVTWVVEEPILLAAIEELQGALPDPEGTETLADALNRALTTGPFATPERELTLAYILGVLLISAPAWQLLGECVADPRPLLYISPSARLARIPWGLLAVPLAGPSREELIAARAAAITTRGTTAARIPWQLADISTLTEDHRLMELADVLMAVPPNIAHAPRDPADWAERRSAAPLLVLDPRVPGQRPDSPLGSVLGRPSAETRLSGHFAAVLARHQVLPEVDSAVDLFRRADADRTWLAALLKRAPSRLLYVGHASAADRAHGYADRAAIHL
ncbi:MAG TPA: CHAT domain-containing protein, partial [Mycobacterium sp.]|nr:CHAT domain-containing protein [Mycobacterium sp.]